MHIYVVEKELERSTQVVNKMKKLGSEAVQARAKEGALESKDRVCEQHTPTMPMG
jgi:hypothetical protein